MKIKTTILLFLAISFTSYAQEKETVLQSIEITIHNYYNGYIERDINKLNKAFDTKNGTMKIPERKNGVIIGYKNIYFKELIPTWGSRKKLSNKVLKNCSLKILNIDIVDDKIASAKISMQIDTTTYIDILSLQKINNKWKITNKIYSTLE